MCSQYTVPSQFVGACSCSCSCSRSPVSAPVPYPVVSYVNLSPDFRDVHGQFYDLIELFRQGGEIPNTNYVFMVRFYALINPRCPPITTCDTQRIYLKSDRAGYNRVQHVLA
jgi:hypothetical protein